MTIIRSIAAIVAGFGFMASTVMVGTIIAAASGVVPASPIGYLAASLTVRMLGAVLGGWLAARIAIHAPFAHAIVLAAIVAGMSIATAINVPQPAWYSVIIGVIGVIGVLLGGWLRASAAAMPPAAGA